ncbi:MAG: hypothetical protein K2M41_09545 [Muribaculaceae bacterium]|nr:hypothetical protein [Muribaculaceae bacterium]
MALKPDISDYYPYSPGSSCDPEGAAEDAVASQDMHNEPNDDLPAKNQEISNLINEFQGKPLEVRTSDDENPPKGFMTLFSHALSWIFSPVIVPTYAIIMVFYLSMLSYAPLSSKWSIIGIVFAMTAVIPALAVFVLAKFGDVSDYALSRRTDRLIPYIVEGGAMLATGFYLTTTGLPDWVGFFFIGAAIATGLNLIINFWWKISAHGAGMGGFIAMILVMNRYGLPPYNLWWWCMGAILAAGLLGMARVWLGRHTPLQTVAGEIVGFLGVLSMELIIPAPI